MVKEKSYTYQEKNDWTRQKHDSRKFYGLIYESDFDTETRGNQINHNGSPLAKRILVCEGFDYFCQTSGECNKHMKEMKVQQSKADVRKGDVIF